jgi:2-succinyl-6-hydroxy-2,4-cyclohexadiene-1-carboxylate synthase
MTHELANRFSVDGVELAWGAGDTLVLCHGFSGSAHDFDLQLDRLSSGSRVVTLDQRGHGRSTKCGAAEAYSLELLADDLARLLSAHGGGPVDLLGHSMGGRVALDVALDHPELVRSLILMDTSAWSFEVADDAVRELLVGFFASYDPAQGLPDFSVMANPEDPLIAACTTPEWQDRKEELLAGFDPYALLSLGYAIFSNSVESRRDRLGEIACPVTVIAGELDHPFVDQAPELAARVGDGLFVVIPGAYHSPQLTHPDDWADAVGSHIERARRRG